MGEREYAQIIAANLKRIAAEAGKTQADISNDLRIGKSTVSTWFRGERIPRMDKIDLLCHYFNVPRVEIMEPHDPSKETYYHDPAAAEIAEFLHKNPQYKVLFDASRRVAPEDIDFVRQMIERTTKEG